MPTRAWPRQASYSIPRSTRGRQGRFLVRDQAREGRNVYTYVSNNPLKIVDPTGLGGGSEDKEVVRAIHDLMNKNKLDRDSYDRYHNDKDLREDIHRELRKLKLGNNKKSNPNVSEEDRKATLEIHLGKGGQDMIADPSSGDAWRTFVYIAVGTPSFRRCG